MSVEIRAGVKNCDSASGRGWNTYRFELSTRPPPLMSVRRRFWEVAEESAQPLLNGRGVLAQARDRLLPVGQIRHQRAAALDIEQLVQRHARPASQGLQEHGVPFIDCGIGVYRTGESLAGIVRTTTCTAERQELQQLPIVDDDDDEYNNIQVADLNALNAIHAVIKWKKLFGFYADLEHEHYSAYTIDGNHLSNEY